MQIFYADILFIVNFFINYIILISTARLSAGVIPRLRIAAAAMIGAGYAVLVLFPSMLFLANAAVKISVGVLMVLAAFGGQKKLLRITLIFFSISAAFAGVIFAVSLLGGGSGGMFTPVGVKTLILSFSVTYLLITVVFKRVAKTSAETVSLNLRRGEKVLSVRALVDTGNSLRDPFTGNPVIVAGVAEARMLFSVEIADVLSEIKNKDAIKVLEELSGKSDGQHFRLLPYNAVGTAGGVLLAFRPDEVQVDGRARKGLLVALSPNDISDNGTYSALIGA